MSVLAKYRWTAKFVSDDNKVVVKQFEEIDELHDLVEKGPSWHELKHIIITYNRKEAINSQLTELQQS